MGTLYLPSDGKVGSRKAAGDSATACRVACSGVVKAWGRRDSNPQVPGSTAACKAAAFAGFRHVPVEAKAVGAVSWQGSAPAVSRRALGYDVSERY